MLKKYDVLLIADEVVTGFGRLGTMFGSDHYGIEPDLITIAKGLTSAYAPLSGVIVARQGLAGAGAGLRRARRRSATAGPIRRIRSAPRPASPISNSSTSSDLVAQCRRDRRLFPRRAARGRRRPPASSATSAARACWRRSSSSPTRDDRVFFDAVAEDRPAASRPRLLERGVIGRAMPQGDILGFAPPLCLTREEADIVVAKTADAVKSVFARI